MFQLLFQILAGTEALNQSFFEPILECIKKRISQQGTATPVTLKKHLIGVFMSAMHYNAVATIRFLESRQMTVALLTAMLEIQDKFTNEYERRFYVLGLSKMLLSGQLPATLQPLIAKLIESIVRVLKKLHDQVNKRLTDQSGKNNVLNNEDTDDEEDDEDSSYEDADTSSENNESNKS